MSADKTTEELPQMPSPVGRMDSHTAAESLNAQNPQEIARILATLPPARANAILAMLSPKMREAVLNQAPQGTDWRDAQNYPEGSVGRLLEDPPAVFRSGTRVSDAVEQLRTTIGNKMVVYLFVVDTQNKLLGVVAFRELLFADKSSTLDDVMLRNPFVLRPEDKLVKAMHEVVTRHYPVYPVCDAQGVLVGQVRGQALFEQQAFEISAQAGAMVGVEKEERLATPMLRSLKFRNPWLLINLLTVFVAAYVVGLFESTIGKYVVLATFLPVLAGQCGNLGAQSLAVTIRGMTLGEMRGMSVMRLMSKEGGLGFFNGCITGAIAALGMWFVASSQGGGALILASTVFIAMVLSCTLSGVAGVIIPIAMKRFGFDPATASSIFLTTVTDISSMGFFLTLATLMLPK
jgi:magnesium transporter